MRPEEIKVEKVLMPECRRTLDARNSPAGRERSAAAFNEALQKTCDTLLSDNKPMRQELAAVTGRLDNIRTSQLQSDHRAIARRTNDGQ